jgi:hypothetical protein
VSCNPMGGCYRVGYMVESCFSVIGKVNRLCPDQRRQQVLMNMSNLSRLMANSSARPIEVVLFLTLTRIKLQLPDLGSD